MKTLIILGHPTIETSVINQALIKKVADKEDEYTIHNIYKAYPNGEIDIEKEHRLIERYDKLVIQFPLFWFNCPPFMKQWLDEVFSNGWAFGSADDKLLNKRILLAVTGGIQEADYQHDGKYKHTLTEVLVPFETLFTYVRADYGGYTAFYGAYVATEADITQGAKRYIKFIEEH